MWGEKEFVTEKKEGAAGLDTVWIEGATFENLGAL